MYFRKYISLFLSVSIFFQAIAPVIAMDSIEKDLGGSSGVSDFSLKASKVESSSIGLSSKRLISSIQELEKNLPFLDHYKSTLAPLTFWSEPGKSAAGILHFAEHNGEIYIFLGERNDEKGSWCNLGGGSDTREDGLEDQVESSSDILHSALDGSLSQKRATTLDDDGARESEEESNGVYTLHRRLLKKCPFIDTYDLNKKMYYRMYWQRVEHIDPEVFLNKLQYSDHDHNKEYTDFKWFKAEDLLTALLDLEHPLRQNIYGPLLNMLSTDSAIAFIKELSTSKKLNRYKRHIRPLCNRLYIIGNTAIDHDTTPVNWSLLNVDSQHELLDDQERGKNNYLSSEQELKKLRFDFAQLPTKELPQALSQFTFQPNFHQVIPVSSLIEQDQLDEAVAAHGMAMVLLKSRFKREGLLPQPQILPVVTPEWNPHCTETLSRIHLRIVLGRDYQDKCHFQTQLKPQRAADIANMRLYFSRYKKAETSDKQSEFKREITPQDSDYEFLADVLEWETGGKIWPTSFHGASSKANNLIKAFTYQRQIFDIEDYNGSIFLRGTDIYFNGIQNLRGLIEKEGVGESDRNRAAMLFMNFVLFAGLQTTRSTSSSVEYTLNDHSVNEVDVDERYEEAAALAGFQNPHYGPFKSIHEQFKGNKDRKHGNSVLLAIRQSPETFDVYNYPTGGGGDFWNPDHVPNLTEMPSSAKIFKDIQAEYERQSLLNEPENFEVDMERKRALFPENRSYLEPRRMKDSTQFYVKSFDRFKLTEEETREYDRQMITTTIATGADWLAGRSQILDGSFTSEPNLKKLHKLVVKGVTGEPLKETLSPAGFIHLVRNGQLDSVKQFLMCFPKVLEYEGLTPQKLIEAATESHNPDLIRYLTEDVLKSDLKTILGLENFYARIRMTLYGENPIILRFLLSQIDPKIIPDDVKLLWFNFTHGSKMRLAILQYILETSPHLSKDVLENALSVNYIPEEAYQTLIDENITTAQELLVMVHDRFLKGSAREYHNTVIPVKVCLAKGADLMALHPTTEESMVFLLPKMKHYLLQEIISWLKNQVDVWKTVNKEGLTLLQVVQKNLLEGRRDNGLFSTLTQMCRSAQLNYKDQSYQPFFDYFGPSEYFPSNSHYILRSPESIEWASSFQNIKNSQDAGILLASCPYPDLITCFQGKISSLGCYDGYFKVSRKDAMDSQCEACSIR